MYRRQNSLESHAYKFRKLMTEEKLTDPADKSTLEKAINDAISWFNAWQGAAKDSRGVLLVVQSRVVPVSRMLIERL